MSTRFSRKGTRPILGTWSGRAAICGVLVAALSATGLIGAGAPAGAAGRAVKATHARYSTSTLALHVVGTVNLSKLAGTTETGHMAHSAEGKNYPHHMTPLGRFNRWVSGHAGISGNSIPSPSLFSIGGSVKGASSHTGINALENSSHNSPYLGGVGDVSPPDQGLGVGPGGAGTAVVEGVNDTFGFYSTSGKQLLAPLAAFQVFDQAPITFMSDPRVMYDAESGHWFLTMFAFPALPGPATVGQYGCGNGGATENGCLPAQFIAVSVTSNGLGSYKVFWFDTSDGTSTGTGGHIGDGCPCFGDYDQLGTNPDGVYISTNEFCYTSSTACANSTTGTFNGTVLYAIPKSKLIAAAKGGAAPTIVKYGVDTVSDAFGAYHLAPSAPTQGSSSPHTEYLVESNANLPFSTTVTGSGLEVFALLGTSALATGGTPTLANTTVATEDYTASPPNAVQKSGPIPYGNSQGVGTTPQLQTDFNAVQEVTYASGQLYAELDTGAALGQQENSAAAWFVLKPSTTASSVSAKKSGNGYVETTQDVAYPVISVNSKGDGYMAFALAGPDMYPSAAYVVFKGASGPSGSVHVAFAGKTPLDDFTCYPPYSACRYGDYSMAQDYNGTIYMATDVSPGGPRDTYANWGTAIYKAPTP